MKLGTRRFLILAAILVPVGALVGYPVGHRTFICNEELSFEVPPPEGLLSVFPSYREYVDGWLDYEVESIKSPTLLSRAVTEDDWRALRRPLPVMSVNTLGKKLKVSHAGNTIGFSVSDADPIIAGLAVRSVTIAYFQAREESTAAKNRQRQKSLDDNLTWLYSEISDNRKQIQEGVKREKEIESLQQKVADEEHTAEEITRRRAIKLTDRDSITIREIPPIANTSVFPFDAGDTRVATSATGGGIGLILAGFLPLIYMRRKRAHLPGTL